VRGRLPQIVFGLLALATVGAFFIVQSLKTEAPIFWHLPSPIPADFNPIFGHTCTSRKGVSLNHRQTTLSLSVTHADTVGVYIVSATNPNGNTVATLSSGTPMAAAPGANQDSKSFTWRGRLADGLPAPDGSYYFRIVLEREDRSINLSQRPVEVLTRPPTPRIRSVRLLGSAAADGAKTGSVTTTTASATATTTTTTGATGRGSVSLPGPAVLSPPHGSVRISFTPGTRGTYAGATIDIYRTDVSGRPALVDTFPVTRLARHWINWNGKIGDAPAPAGTYLIGITVEDLACNRGSWPLVVPPSAGTTPSAGVTIRYLSVTPPLTPTVSGSQARVAISSPAARFSWQLRRSGSPKLLAHGSGAAGRAVIHVRMPPRQSGLYTLTVSAGTQSAAVPLVASQAGAAAAHARVVVVLPMLTWMGNTPVDDTGDGIPGTLRAGDAVSLARPMVDGLPTGFGEDTTLLGYLTTQHLSYQLTTDVALSEGIGPSLADRGGVVFAAGENFLPAGLESILRGFVKAGGRVLALGTGSFSAASHISGFPAAPHAGVPRLTPLDPFGARRGPVTPTGGELISANGDDFALFNNAGEFSGFNQYQPIVPPAGAAGRSISVAGIGSGAPAILAFHDGAGTVIELGLPGFAASLASNADAQHLLANAWQILSQ
jgi:hypothetical protein